MPANPFSDPLFLTIVPWFAATFMMLASGALWRERRRRRHPDERSLIAPVATAVVAASIFLLALFAGGIVLVIFVEVVGLLGLREFANITKLEAPYYGLATAWLIGSIPLAAFWRTEALPLLPLGLFLAVTLVPIISGKIDGAVRQAGGAMFGYLYIGLPLSYLVSIRSTQTWGLRLLLIVCAAAWLSDTCGYIVGSKLKGPKLASTVSPGKTWSGAIGSVAGTIAGVLVMQLVLHLALGIAGLVLLGTVIAVTAIWSDLVESFVKRDFHVKDAGAILPGFGGVLDRFDSLLITIPVTYYLILQLRPLALMR